MQTVQRGHSGTSSNFQEGTDIRVKEGSLAATSVISELNIVEQLWVPPVEGSGTTAQQPVYCNAYQGTGRYTNYIPSTDSGMWMIDFMAVAEIAKTERIRENLVCVFTMYS